MTDTGSPENVGMMLPDQSSCFSLCWRPGKIILPGCRDSRSECNASGCILAGSAVLRFR